MKWLQTQITWDFPAWLAYGRNSWPMRHPLAAILILGLCLQWIQHARNRWYWMDEASLSANLVGATPWDWTTPLKLTQLAPLGFLTIERSLGAFSDARWVLRLWPLVMGSLALWWTWQLASDQKRRGIIAAAILAFAPTTIYFSSELKPYIGDMAAALAGWLIARRLSDDEVPWTIGKTGPWIGLGAILPWFSFGSIFILAAVGIVGFCESLRNRQWKRTGLWCGVGCLWIVSFACHYELAHRLLGGSRGMWGFWDFAFLCMPPQTIQEWIAWPRTVLNLFVNPLHCLVPSRWLPIPVLPVVNPYSPADSRGMSILIVPSLLMFLAGCHRLVKTEKAWLMRWLLPIGLGLVASVCRLYPFHGRLVLFVMPSLVWIIAAGIDAVFEKNPKLGWFVLGIIGFLPWSQSLTVLFESLDRHGYNALGDL